MNKGDMTAIQQPNAWFVANYTVNPCIVRGGTDTQTIVDCAYGNHIYVDNKMIADTELGAVGICITEVEILRHTLDLREKRLEKGLDERAKELYAQYLKEQADDRTTVNEPN
jgi:hypothetical protein